MKPDWQLTDWFIHQRLAAQMDERLAILKHIPQHITIVGADCNISCELLQQRFPQAQLIECDEREDYLLMSAQEREHKLKLWQKLLGKKVPQVHTSLLTAGTTASTDIIWSNLGFVAHGEPTALFDHWSEVLHKDGLLFFTHFGPDTLQEIYELLQVNGITCSDRRFIDMHDLGDMLFHHGFYDPVMDVDRLTLTYQQTARFWRDMEITGLWQALTIPDEAQEVAQNIVNQAIHNGSLSGVTLEVVFGHAVKKLHLPENEALINFYPHQS